jgi:hypothetical protein
LDKTLFVAAAVVLAGLVLFPVTVGAVDAALAAGALDEVLAGDVLRLESKLCSFCAMLRLPLL